MADKRIIDLTEEQAPAIGDYLAVDNATSGTKKLLMATLLATGKYEQKGNQILFELPNYIGSGTRFNFEFDFTINGQTVTVNANNVGLGENRLFIYFDNPLILILVYLDELIREEDNKQYGVLTICGPNNVTLSSSLNSFDICADIRIATLAAGSTTVTFTNVPTTGDNFIDVYTSVAGLEYTAVDDTTSGELTYTFEAQESAVTVYLVIREVS